MCQFVLFSASLICHKTHALPRIVAIFLTLLFFLTGKTFSRVENFPRTDEASQIGSLTDIPGRSFAISQAFTGYPDGSVADLMVHQMAMQTALATDPSESLSDIMSMGKKAFHEMLQEEMRQLEHAQIDVSKDSRYFHALGKSYKAMGPGFDSLSSQANQILEQRSNGETSIDIIDKTAAGATFMANPETAAFKALGALAAAGKAFSSTSRALHWADEAVGAANSAPARVFWSGGDEARLAAEAFAKQSGGVTLEMTAAGQRLQQATKGMDWADAKPLWETASADFARGATGTVNVFQNGTRGVSLESVWRGVEYPLLKQQGNGIIYNVTTPLGPVRVP
jgi:hypothetical protein